MNILITKMAKLRLQIKIICPVSHSSSMWQSQDSNPHPANSRVPALTLLFVLHPHSFSTSPTLIPLSPHTSVVLKGTFKLPEKLKKILVPQLHRHHPRSQI